MSDNKKITSVLTIITVVLMPVAVLWWGYVTSVLWGWFITPVFTNLPSLSILQAYGLVLVIGLLTKTPRWRGSDVESERFENTISTMTTSFMHPAVTLTVGYFARMFL